MLRRRQVWALYVLIISAVVISCHGDAGTTATTAAPIGRSYPNQAAGSAAALTGVAIGRPIGALNARRQRLMCRELCAAGLGGQPCGRHCASNLLDELHRQSVPHGQYVSNVGGGIDVASTRARKDVCPLLCSNRLGSPLCTCTKRYPQLIPRPGAENVTTDWQHICEYFCLRYEFQLQGCRPCPVIVQFIQQDRPYAMQLTSRMALNNRLFLNAEATQASGQAMTWLEKTMAQMLGMNSTAEIAAELDDTRDLTDDDDGGDDINWDEWCKKKCKANDGGAACNCDVLPLF